MGILEDPPPQKPRVSEFPRLIFPVACSVTDFWRQHLVAFGLRTSISSNKVGINPPPELEYALIGGSSLIGDHFLPAGRVEFKSLIGVH